MSSGRRTVGELLLIISGVFVALAAERWVAGRSDRDLAAAYAVDLAADLLEDSVTHAGRMNRARGRARALELMIDDLNGVGPRLEGPEALRVLFLAQNVPTGQTRNGTYQDLMSSGNMRLLDPELRRSVVEYYAQLEQNAETMSLFSSGKPRFADLVPGRAKGRLSGLCRPEITGSETDCGGEDAEVAYGELPAPEREALSLWRDLPQVRMDIQSEITETNNVLRVFRDTREDLQAALEMARSRVSR
jgi:hypothetical protein